MSADPKQKKEKAEQPRWESLQKPPPPRPLAVASVPAASAPVAAAPTPARTPAGTSAGADENAATAAAQSAAEPAPPAGARPSDEQAAPAPAARARTGRSSATTRPGRHLQSAPAAGPSAAGTPTTAARPAPAPRGTSKVQAKLETLLDELDLDATVTSIERLENGRTRPYVVQLDLGPDTDVEDLEPHADEFAALLRVPAVRLVPDGDTAVRIEALPRSTGRSRQVAVWVPLALKNAVEETKDPEEPATAFVLGAFNRQYAQMHTFFTRRAEAAGPMMLAPTRVRHGIENPTQLWMYLNAQQEAVLDEAVRASGAGSRSALITRMLEEELGVVTTPRYSG